jgi:glycosyltransferase involved in cell wall biosynthesis
MPKPIVSIVMPTLNSRTYLTERMQTILAQTLTDWELIVVDSYSTDGTWELLQDYARRDSRLHLSQAPKEGIYPALNRCIQQATGDYVYIATSDDTMLPTCLEVMVGALNAYPNCDICHTCLKVIDAQGEEVTGWWGNTPIAQFYGELMGRKHKRLAPYDGLLYCALYSVFISLTQLLIRRSLFDRVGLFRSDWGSMGDFEWGMRSTLVCNTLHLPEPLATWRIHDHQATAITNPSSSKFREKFCEMIVAALPILKTHSPKLFERLDQQRLLFPYRLEQFTLGLAEQRNFLARLLFMVKFLSIRSDIVGLFWQQRLLKRGEMKAYDRYNYIRTELKRLDISEWIQVLD